MKMFKNALLLGGVLATLTLTSCLKGGNSASYTALGTVATDKYGNTVFYADNAGMTYRPETASTFEGMASQRISCKMDINYDNQTSNDYVTTVFSDIKKLEKFGFSSIPTVADTTGKPNVTAWVTPITSAVSVCVQEKRYYINLNLSYLAEKKDSGPEHEFTLYNDEKATSESETDIYLYLLHNENGEVAGKEMKTKLSTFEITSLVYDKAEGKQGKVYLTYKGTKDFVKIELPFVKYKFE